MSETREQFRERIKQLHDDVYGGSDTKYTEAAISNEDIWRGQEVALADAAEAVYAQALRDVLSGEGDYFDKDQVSSRRLVYDYLMWFAAERGIEVGGEQ